MKEWFDACMSGRTCVTSFQARKYMKEEYGPNLEKLALLRSKIKYA
jgi:hypothetical protein